jgi:hypothetical protein
MTRLSILVGIGLMLVGAMAYAMPAVQDFEALYPAFAGIVIATAGFVGKNHENARHQMIAVATTAAALVMIWACLRVVPDMLGWLYDTIPLIADVDTIALCGLLIYYAVKSFLAVQLLRQQEEEALKNLEGK